MTELNRVLTGVSMTEEEQLKLSVELSMNNFIQAYLQVTGGDPDSEDDVNSAMSLWFKASADVKAVQLQRFEEGEGVEDEDQDDEDSEAA